LLRNNITSGDLVDVDGELVFPKKEEEMQKTILLFIASIIGMWLGGMWAWAFYHMIQGRYIYESTMWIATLEFYTAVAVTLLSAGIFIWTWLN